VSGGPGLWRSTDAAAAAAGKQSPGVPGWQGGVPFPMSKPYTRRSRLESVMADAGDSNGLPEKNLSAGEAPASQQEPESNPTPEGRLTGEGPTGRRQLISFALAALAVTSLGVPNTPDTGLSSLLNADGGIRSFSEQFLDRLAQRQQMEESEGRRSEERLSKLAKLEAQPSSFAYFAAFAASCVSTLVVFPVDTIKTKRIFCKDRSSETCEIPDFPPESLQGFRSLYNGLSGALLQEGPTSAIYLGVYESVKNALLKDPTFAPYPLLVYLLSGALGEVLASFISAPTEEFKARRQSGVDASPSEFFERVVLDEKGRRTLVNAWVAILFRDVPMGAIQLTIFEGLKNYFENSPLPYLNLDVDSVLAEVLFGTIGGAIGAVLTTPGDVIATRIETQAIETCDNPVGFFNMSKQVLQEGGFRALCTGWRQRASFWAPYTGIFLSCYCYIRRFAADMSIDPHGIITS